MKRTLASLALAALFAGAVHAAPLDLPAQPLADALAQLARQSGAQLLFKTDDLKGLRAPALRGDLAPAEALDRLLRGSGFGFRQSGDAYVVVRVTTGDAGEARLPPIDIQAEREGAYLAHKANDVLKMNVPLKDLPMSVQVVPDTVLRDRAVTKTSQMLDNVSGIHAESSYGGNGATFFNVRGFSTSNGLRDGFREYGYIAYRDVQAIDRIEVLKGPAGTLYGGLGAIGGQVNTVSKRPEAGTFGTLSLLGGSFGQWRPSFDVNVGAERGLSFRVNGAYEQNDGFRDGAGFDSYSISPSIAWRGENDRFTLLTEFNHLERDRFDFGVPNVPVYRQLDRNRYYGLIDGVYPGYTGDFGRNSTQAVTAIYEHDLDPDWMLRVAAHYTHATQKSQQTFPDVTSFTGTTLTNYVYSGADEWSTDHAVQIELHGSTMLAGRKHQLLFGFEHSYAKHGYADSTLSSYDVDLFNPAAVNPITLLSAAGGFDNNGIGTDLGLYVNDLIDLAPDWKLLAGLRLDQFRNTSESAGASIHDTETTLFGRLGRSYLPNVGHGIGSETFPPKSAPRPRSA